MFQMIIERQLDLEDRTLLLGKPEPYGFPERIKTRRIPPQTFDVIGVSGGVRPPFVSLEIKRITESLVGQAVYG